MLINLEKIYTPEAASRNIKSLIIIIRPFFSPVYRKKKLHTSLSSFSLLKLHFTILYKSRSFCTWWQIYSICTSIGPTLYPTNYNGSSFLLDGVCVEDREASGAANTLVIQVTWANLPRCVCLRSN